MGEFVVGLALVIVGGFTLALGVAHFFFPILLDFKTAIPKDGAPLKPFRLWLLHYPTERRDVHGISWVMNHATSYVLVTIGLLEICWWLWLSTSTGRLLSLWIAGWWFLRAGSQLYLGRRRGDWWILVGFASFGILHVLAGLIM
jgi:hypothetical protein